MATIRPIDLPAAASVNPAAAFITDTGSTVEKATAGQIVDAAIPLASQAEAEAGLNNAKRVTPLRVKQAIDALGVSAANLAATDSGKGAALVGFLQGGTGAVARTVEAKARETVSVLDYIPVAEHAAMKAGTSTFDASAHYQAAIDANKGGTIVHPAGYTIIAAGTILSGSSYNGTSIIVEGTYLLKAVTAGGNNFQGTTWCGIVFHDVEGCTLDVPGMIDGNRTNQYPSEHIFLVCLAGARHITIPTFNCRELRGDGIYISIKTFTTASTNSSDIVIGTVNAYNSADDGRNGISIISVDGLQMAGGVMRKIGGVINGVRMPGGVDIEPDDASKHLVKNIASGPWFIESAGTSGIASIGHAITSDAVRDWNVQDVKIAPSVVVNTAGAGYPIFKRNRRVTADLNCIQTGTRTAGCSVDYQDFCDFRIKAKGVTQGVIVGGENFVNDSSVHIEIEDHSGPALLVTGANRCRFTGHVRGGQGAGSYGVQTSPGARNTTFTASISGTTMTVTAAAGFVSVGATLSGTGVTGGTTVVRQLTIDPGATVGRAGTYEVSASQTVASTTITPVTAAASDNIFSVDVPYDANNTFGFLTSAGLALTRSVVANCAFLGYPNFTAMFGLNVFLPTRNVQGRNYAGAIPANGYWGASDIVWNTGTAAGGTPGWVCTAEGNPGTWKAMANVAA